MARKATFAELVEIMRTLRGPEGCPWDKEQTPQSIKKNLIEEAYEVAEAIDSEDEKDLKGELGDLLFQIIFHSQMASEKKLFDINNVIEAIAQKIKRRHPHIFGNLQAGSPAEVLTRWEQIKRAEREEHESQLSGLPLSLPALQYAFELQSRAARVGFDWEDGVAILQKLDEEVQELKTALGSGQKLAREEMGDFLFTIVNITRHLGVDAEDALRATCKKFTRRFNYMEKRAKEMGRTLEEMTLEEKDVLWEEAKGKAGE